MTEFSTADVSAFLARLGVEREPPSVDGLVRLHRAVLERVPYETTWIHLGEWWSVDRLASLRRIAYQRRGGYCFHINGAFSLLLAALGYNVSLHVGGVHRADGPTPEAMTNHLVLQVHGLPADDCPVGSWYVDAGLGDALYEPMPLIAGTYQQGPFEFGLAASDASFADWQFHHHQSGSFAGMAFRSEPAVIDDFAARNTILSTSPDSAFVQTLTVQRRDATGVDVVRGQMLQRVESTVVSERTLASESEWFDALADVFDLPLTDVVSADRHGLWTRVHAAHEAWLAAPS